MGIPAVRGVRLAPQTPLLELIGSGWGAAGVLGGTCIGFRRGSRRSWVGGTDTRPEGRTVLRIDAQRSYGPSGAPRWGQIRPIRDTIMAASPH
jgi:hypothetical protein